MLTCCSCRGPGLADDRFQVTQHSLFWPPGTHIDACRQSIITHKMKIDKCFLKEMNFHAGEVTQQLWALTTFPQELNLVPRTHIRCLTCNFRSRGSGSVFWTLQAPTQTQSHKHKYKRINLYKNILKELTFIWRSNDYYDKYSCNRHKPPWMHQSLERQCSCLVHFVVSNQIYKFVFIRLKS